VDLIKSANVLGEDLTSCCRRIHFSPALFQRRDTPNNVRILETLTTLLLVGIRVIILSTHIRPRHSQEHTPKLRASTVCTPSHEGPANNTSFTSSQRGYQMPDSQRLSHRPSNEEQGMKSKRTKKDRKSPDKAMGTR
jgi:hypothetical protein